jgi:hypothetical protein
MSNSPGKPGLLTFKDIFHVNPRVQQHEYYRLNYILQHFRPRHCTFTDPQYIYRKPGLLFLQ